MGKKRKKRRQCTPHVLDQSDIREMVRGAVKSRSFWMIVICGCDPARMLPVEERYRAINTEHHSTYLTGILPFMPMFTASIWLYPKNEYPAPELVAALMECGPRESAGDLEALFAGGEADIVPVLNLPEDLSQSQFELCMTAFMARFGQWIGV